VSKLHGQQYADIAAQRRCTKNAAKVQLFCALYALKKPTKTEG